MDPHSFSKLDPNPHSPKKLDPDPHKINADPKHLFWLKPEPITIYSFLVSLFLLRLSQMKGDGNALFFLKGSRRHTK
jgi:hypothetical protein